MNVLVLSNPARGYYKFFNSLAAEFANDGHRVMFAVDCRYTAFINNLAETRLPVHVFSEFNAGGDPNVLNRYANYNLSQAFLSDFERAHIYGGLAKWRFNFADDLKRKLLWFFEDLLKGQKINAVIFENVSDIFAYFCWFACDKLGVHYCGLTSSRLPGRFMLTCDPLEESAPIAAALQDIRDGTLRVPAEVMDTCKRYIEHIDTIVPDYMKFNGLEIARLTSNQASSDKLRVWWAAIKFSTDRNNSFKVGNPLLRRLRVFQRAVARRVRIPLIRRYYDAPVAGELYLLYPLHYHPESSTSVLAPSCLDELEVIRNIAFNLPEGVRLYVKDHASAYGLPRRAFYATLRHLPNVRLIEPFARTKELIRHCSAVITLSSTVGYEALLLGKRVFLYGRVFYESHPNVVRVDSPAGLFELLRRWLDAPLVADSAYNQRFVEAYYLCSLPGVLDMAGPAASALAQAVYPEVLGALRSGARYHGFGLSRTSAAPPDSNHPVGTTAA